MMGRNNLGEKCKLILEPDSLAWHPMPLRVRVQSCPVHTGTAGMGGVLGTNVQTQDLLLELGDHSS